MFLVLIANRRIFCDNFYISSSEIDEFDDMDVNLDEDEDSYSDSGEDFWSHRVTHPKGISEKKLNGEGMIVVKDSYSIVIYTMLQEYFRGSKCSLCCSKSK